MLSSDRLCGDFSALGVAAGQVVLLRSSLSSLGHVDGGADTVVAALRAVLGPGGTLAVPAYSPQNSDTSPQYRAAVAGMTAEEVARHRAAMTPYDPATTPSSGIGRIAERVRTLPGARRSAHPHTSFAAVGPLAAAVTDGHALDCLLGERSPLARLYDLGAFVLLLGVGYAKCTAFHLAEYRRTGTPPRRSYRAVVADARGRRWTEFVDVDVDDGDFARIGADFERACETRRGRVGHADSRLFPIRSAVDHAATWLAAHRPATPS
ncbi:aminoglycoside 3-N-acetyltransferase [Nonomuraea pusilla]|uniref:Aminoglycoside N(3)-acetyltransferase n=1 Tax=Nonomuraea pusilla TaxID=46177 RepID=A0A1H7RY10_9ACTN|nr:aminoglycoside 3-N-acetyltransferase [Nonomuraea pusilla]